MDVCTYHWKQGINTTWCSGIIDQKKGHARVCRFAHDACWVTARTRRCREDALNSVGEHVPERYRFREAPQFTNNTLMNTIHTGIDGLTATTGRCICGNGRENVYPSTRPRRPHNFNLSDYNECWRRIAHYCAFLIEMWGGARVP